MRHSYTLAIILLATLSAAPSDAQDQCLGPPPQGNATISGTVTAADGGSAVLSSLIALGEGPGFAALFGTGFTNLDGSYSIEVSAPATYVVAALPIDTVHAPEFWDGKLSRADAAKIDVSDGETVDNVDFTVLTGGTMSGTVTAAEGGAALDGVRVLATIIGDLPTAGATLTDGDGNYTLTGLAASDYQVMFVPDDSPDNYLTEFYNNKQSLPADPVHVTLAGVSNIDAALEQGARIDGNVTGPNNEALANIEVEALPTAPGYQFGRATSDDNGDYSMVVATGTYNVVFTATTGLSSEVYNNKFDLASADDVSATAPGTTSNIDAKLDQSAEITGKVTDKLTGDPIQFAVVSATEDGGIPSASGTVSFTDAQGVYQLNTNLHTGEYKIGFFAQDYVAAYYSDKTSPLDADPVSATAPGTTPDIDQALTPCDQVTTTTIGGTTTTLGGTTTTLGGTTTTLGGTTTTSLPPTTTVTTGSTTTVTGVTTTTLGSGGVCGDPVALTAGLEAETLSTDGGVLPRTITASDALLTLKAAVGSGECALCLCDVNDSGTITASDALIVLKRAVGQSVVLVCPAC